MNQNDNIKENSLEQKKQTYYYKLIEYNLSLNAKNNLQNQQDISDLKYYPKPSEQQKKSSTEEKLLSIVSKQKKNSSSEIINLSENKNTKKTEHDKKMEENLESKYGKGFKILKMAGYQIGKGLGVNEQGITDPIMVKKRKERAGISNDEEFENAFDMGKENEFIVGKKRLKEEKEYEETNEEFKNFELLLSEYKNNPNDYDKIWSLLDEDKRIKKRFYGKGGKFMGFKNFRMKFKDELPELKGKKIKIVGNNEEDKKKLLAKMMWASKDKIVEKIRKLYENINDKLLCEKITNTNNIEKNKISANINAHNIIINKLLQNSKSFKCPEKHKDLLSVINYIQDYINLIDSNPKLYKNKFNKFSLYCIKKSMEYIEENNFTIKQIIDKEIGTQLSEIISLIKELLFKTYNERTNNASINLEEDDNDDNSVNKANDYYIMFISRIILNDIFAYVEDKWNVKDSKTILLIYSLYKNIIPKVYMDSLNKKIISRISNNLKYNYKFIYENNEELKIHIWLHPLLDILLYDDLKIIFNIIQEEIISSIEKWDLSNITIRNTLIELLSPWVKIFDNDFWRFLYKNYFSNYFKKSFHDDNNKNILEGIKFLVNLNDKKIMPSKKCCKMLQKYFFDKFKYDIKKNIRNNKNYEEINNKSKLLEEIINIVKTKSNIYDGVKREFDECSHIINSYK